MISYLDASALVKRYVEEEGSDVVQGLMETSLPATSRYSVLEIASAVNRRRRSGELSGDLSERILAELQRDLAALYIVELVPEVVDIATDLLHRHPLRAGDSLQLGSCRFLREKMKKTVRFVAFDQRLNEAARDEGFALVPN